MTTKVCLGFVAQQTTPTGGLQPVAEYRKCWMNWIKPDTASRCESVMFCSQVRRASVYTLTSLTF